MEANSSSCTCNSIVREALNENNYEMWSSYMEDYLLGQDLWDVIIESEPEETDQSSPDSSKNIKKTWRKNNALALHAIKMSCGPDLASKIITVKSAKEAWDLLATSAAGSEKRDVNNGENDVEEVQSTGSADQDKDDVQEEEIDYQPLFKAAGEEDWPDMEKFLDSHPKAVTAKVFYDENTLLHYLLDNEQEKNAALLLNRLAADDLEISNEIGRTALAVAANSHYPGLLQLLELMVTKNPKLPNIGTPFSLPVVIAAQNGFKDATRYLYNVTDKSVLDPESGKQGVSLLINCIESKIFDIASNLVEEFPKILRQSDREDDDDEDEEDKDNDSNTNKEDEKGKEDDEDEDGTYPIYTLAKTFSALSNENGQHKNLSRLKQWRSDVGEWIMTYVYLLLGVDKIPKVSYDEKLIYHQACAFLQQVCVQVSTFDIETLVEAVYNAMIEATIRGNIEFITKMIIANSNLIWAYNNNGNIFWHAIKNRHEKIFSLIYGVIERKNTLLSCYVDEEDNNIIHLVAMLAPMSILDRTAGPALQVQKELQWFQEVWNVANPRDREELNNEKLTPRELFTKSHEKLIDAGEKAMKDTAQSSTVVGALIVTIMFAAAFTVPGGNNQDTGYPMFVSDSLFRIFIVCDALSLYSSATSVLIFLGILTSRYAENDFLVLLPRKLILGVSTLFFSIATMMVTFCAALALMLNGRLQLIFPIVLLAFVPVILFLSSIFPLLSKIYYSTFGPSMFDKNTKLPGKTDFKKIMNNPAKVTDRLNKDMSMRKNPPSVASEENTNNSSRIDQIV